MAGEALKAMYSSGHYVAPYTIEETRSCFVAPLPEAMVAGMNHWLNRIVCPVHNGDCQTVTTVNCDFMMGVHAAVDAHYNISYAHHVEKPWAP